MLTFAVGDIHGCFDALVSLVAECKRYANTETYRFVFIGDYVDRGPKSREVIDFLMGLENSTCLMGNHDQMFYKSVIFQNQGTVSDWVRNGALETIKSYGYDSWDQWETIIEDSTVRQHAGWIMDLPYTAEDEFRFYVHAGIRPNIPLEDQKDEDLVWIRGPFTNCLTPHPKLIVHGHTPDFVPYISHNRIGLDTGAVFKGGKLTAAVFSDTEAQPIDILSIIV
jgi:serine/threonine protein phosphatase 1